MRDELVICTKDRPRDLARCLSSAYAQVRPPSRIIVVDSSESDDSRSIARESAEESAIPIVVLSSAPGLTLQRNVALGSLLDETEVVHFVDDDTVLEPNYLRAIVAQFEAEPEAVGVGGRILGLPPHRPSRLKSLLLMDSVREGALLKSGVNVLSFYSASPKEVDWLSGCSMSYRVRAISGLLFDERRTGNGVGEDVDFSARARDRGSLFWTPNACLEHLQSPINRDQAPRLVRRWVRHRYRLALDKVGPVRRGWVLYACLGEAVVLGVGGLRYRSKSRFELAGGYLLGIVDAMRRVSI